MDATLLAAGRSGSVVDHLSPEIAGGGADLEIHNAFVHLRDRAESTVGQVQMQSVAAAPPLIALIRVVARAGVGDLDYH